MLSQTFLNAFISLLVITNPLGVASVFVGLMAHSPAKEIKATAFKAVGVAFGVLLFFAFFGESLLTQLGIRLPSFHVAGGILLFTIAYRMIFSDTRFGSSKTDANGLADRADVAVFPLAIPLISGPGCMTATILLMSRTEGRLEEAAVLLALTIVMALTLATLLASRAVLRVLGNSGNIIVARVMGVLLAARSVQFIVDGLRDMHTLFFTS
ncbi:MAG: MarC family protein [Bdellovibrionales bacterium]|jgi:multiple antibiotic resistance protein